MAFRKFKCPHCGSMDTIYLDKGRLIKGTIGAGSHETPWEGSLDKIYHCKKCNKQFRRPIEFPYSFRKR